MSSVPEFARQIGEIARAAGEAILTIYRSDFSVQTKADASPLTAADLAAQKVIMDGLSSLDPVLPVLSEEAKALAWSSVSIGRATGWSIRSTARANSSSATANLPSTSR
jgi:3'(2'), 5'-bisphosphate nucleotidase